jgi:hypothetical protein
VLRSKSKLQKHFASITHVPLVRVPRVRPDSEGRHKCKKCDERFPGKKALRLHMSSKHYHIPCINGAACTRMFGTPSGLISHLESGACHSGMTRARMNELIFAHDKNRFITSTEPAKVNEAAEGTGTLAQKPSRYLPSGVSRR